MHRLWTQLFPLPRLPRPPLASLLIPLASLIILLPSQAPCLDFYAEAGFHMETLHLDLAKRKDQLHESFDKVRWSNILAPEMRFGASQRLCSGFTLEADSGFLLNAPASNNFSARYREDIGSRTFTCRVRNKAKISGNDFSIAAAYAIALCPQIQLTALMGYAEQRRKFHLHPGKMKTHMDADSDPQTVKISTMQYKAHWLGPWAGIRIGYSLYKHMHLLLDAQYHYTLLRTQGKWQMQELLCDGYQFDNRISAKQHGNAHGFKVNAAIVHVLCERWKLVLHGCYAWLRNTNGNDSTHHTQTVSKASQKPISQGCFHTAPQYRTQWQAWALLGGIDYEF